MRRLILTAALSLASATGALAAPITYYFTADIFSEANNSGLLPTTGGMFSGQFTYDTATAASGSTSSSTTYDGALSEFSFTGGSLSVSGTNGAVTIFNNASTVDRFRATIGGASVTDSGSLISGYSAVTAIFDFPDGTGTVFPDTSLPASLDLSDFLGGSIQFFATAQDSSGADVFDSFEANMTFFSDTGPEMPAVPLPASGLLLLGGLVGLNFAKRRTTKLSA